MGYANQLVGGGDGRERARALASAGAAGVIVADLTPDEGGPFEAAAAEAGIAVVYLVAPTTSPERRAWVAARSGGFLYCVSLVGRDRRADGPAVDRRAGSCATSGPRRRSRSRWGSGCRRRRTSGRSPGPGADGVIVASALVDALGPEGRDLERLSGLVRTLRAATATATATPTG